MLPPEERILWTCTAAGQLWSYQAKALDPRASSFNLDVYEGPVLSASRYSETVEIIIASAPAPLTGQGQTADHKTIRVKAFDDSVVFEVELAGVEFATGRCSRLAEMN